LDDAYLFGRITALHSSSDLIATGIAPSEALSNVVLPEGHARTQQQMLAEFLEGANQEFHSLGASIVGGHTIVGPRFEAGFTVVGSPWGNHPLSKGGLQPGDTLYITKPLGIGVLLAAHMRSKCSADAYEELLRHMLAPQQEYARIATELGVRAATDITGFGLIGHLLEMLEASDCTAQLDIASVPILQSAVQLSREGIASSLLPDNMRLSRHVHADDKLKSDDRYSLLFDPQTCGGILFGVARDRKEGFLRRAEQNGLPSPIAIGSVSSLDSNAKRLWIS
ncbi:MAG: selenide, water dikinase SelD, partial [Planctomycetota bacterium]